MLVAALRAVDYRYREVPTQWLVQTLSHPWGGLLRVPLPLGLLRTIGGCLRARMSTEEIDASFFVLRVLIFTFERVEGSDRYYQACILDFRDFKSGSEAGRLLEGPGRLDKERRERMALGRR